MYRVGDRVTILEGVDAYSVTTSGSFGIITEIDHTHATIKFTYLASGRYGHSDFGGEENVFRIPISALRITVPADPQKQILRKIKEMENRQKQKKATRKKAVQEATTGGSPYVVAEFGFDFDALL